MGRYVYKPGLAVRVKPGVIGKLKTVVEKSASGDPVHITDAAKDLPARDLTAAIGPVQDLHGYDAPWPAGGGKNLINYDAWKTVEIVGGTAVWENNGVTLTAAANDCYTYALGGVFPAAIPVIEGKTYILSWEETSDASGVNYIFGNNSTSYMESANNNTVKQISYTVPSGVTYITFRFGVAAAGNTISYKNIMIRESTQPSGWVPYENICPITGRTETNVTRAGKNLIDLATTPKGTLRRCSASVSDNVLTVTCTEAGQVWLGADGSVGSVATKAFSVRANYGDTLAISFDTNLVSLIAYEIDEFDRLLISPTDTHLNNKIATYTVSNQKCRTVCFRITCSNNAALNDTFSFKMQVERNASASAYEVPNIQTVSVEWTDEAGTIYGGEYDVTTGILTVTHYYVVLDGTQNISKHAGGVGFYIFLSNNNWPACASTQDGTVGQFNYYKLGTLASANGSGFVGSNTIQFRNDAVDTANDMKTYLSQNPLQVVYPLASPFTVQLTAGEEVRMLGGENNLWADRGSVRLDYYGDVQ